MTHGPFRTPALLASTVLAVGGLTGATRPGTEAEVAATQPIYFGDKACDVDIVNASTDTRIKHIAAALANRIYSEMSPWRSSPTRWAA